MSYPKGQEAELYVGTAGSTAATLVGIVGTNAFSHKANKVSSNWRDSRFTSNDYGQKDFDGSFTLRREVSEAVYTTIRSALKSTPPIPLAFLFKSANGVSTDQIDADFMIESNDFDEQMDQHQAATIKYAVYIKNRAPVGI